MKNNTKNPVNSVKKLKKTILSLDRIKKNEHLSLIKRSSSVRAGPWLKKLRDPWLIKLVQIESKNVK